MDYKTVYKGGCGEIMEKKSRFIAQAFPIESEEEAAEILEKVKKQYWDARHHCWAYVLRHVCRKQPGTDVAKAGGIQIQERFSDDGEPAGTAGKPILEVLRGRQLYNTLLIVTRYFGGTLLGTGGLVRAYTQSAQAGIAASVLITKITGYKLRIQTDYSGMGKIQYILASRNIPLLETIYTDSVAMTILISAAKEAELITALTEATNARAEISREAACQFAYTDHTPILFENSDSDGESPV